MANVKENSKFEVVVQFIALWVARLALAVLAYGGAMHFLGGVDEAIRYPFAALAVAFLLKETL